VGGLGLSIRTSKQGQGQGTAIRFWIYILDSRFTIVGSLFCLVVKGQTGRGGFCVRLEVKQAAGSSSGARILAKETRAGSLALRL
jgi:hypothetical protein